MFWLRTLAKSYVFVKCRKIIKVNNNKRSGKANIISDKAAEWEPRGVRILAQAAVCALIRCVCCVLSCV